MHFSIRNGDKADSTRILTALAVDLEGNKEVVARLSVRRGRQRGPSRACCKTSVHEEQLSSTSS